jgi:hypothetical protein
MAKAKGGGSTRKISFGSRKSGKPNGKKSYGPTAQKPKRYLGQGR